MTMTMTKHPGNPFSLLAVFFFLSFVGIAHSVVFKVQGQLYCDTCRINFLTRASQPIQGGRVRLECREREGGEVTYNVEGETDERGGYELEVEGEREEEVCEVVPFKSNRDDCNDVTKDGHGSQNARITLTTNNGIAGTDRLANPLFFLKHKADGECTDILKEIGLVAGDIA